MDTQTYTILLATLPALVVALVTYFSIKTILKQELLKQRFQLLKNNQKEVLPLKLQAYERFTLLLDRISTNGLLVRVIPTGEDKHAYKNLLIATLNQEFEHNLTQQIYISDECWKAINSAKNTVISQLHTILEDEAVINAQTYRNVGLTKFTTLNGPTNIAQVFIRTEVGELF